MKFGPTFIDVGYLLPSESSRARFIIFRVRWPTVVHLRQRSAGFTAPPKSAEKRAQRTSPDESVSYVSSLAGEHTCMTTSG
jgi:hypothetical protein